ncbi:MAG: SRPBCC family protein [Ferrimicrobium sp.]
MTKSPRMLEAELVIAAQTEEVFDFVARPANHSLMDGSGSVKGARTAPERLSLGATFGMNMRIAVPYRITNRVVAFQEGRELAWRHSGRHVWRYRFFPLGAGSTRVVESFEWDRAPLKLVYELTGVPGRNLLAMRRTLEKLKRLVEDTTPPSQ